MRVADIHTRVAWPAVLAQLGIAESFLRPKKAGPCPSCGGRDRYTFDNRAGRGDFFCRHCGPGSGFDLLMRVHGWNFSEARRRVIEAAGLGQRDAPPIRTPAPPPQPIAEPSDRVRRLVRESCQVADCADAREYLKHRGLWPLPELCGLRAHPSVEYFADGVRVGRFPALIAEVRDIDGNLASAHVTYLQHGRKLAGHEPRKLLSPLTGRRGCAARLMPPLAGDQLGVGEGIETCLSAARIHGVPTWAALSAALLQKFEPPPAVRRLLIFADRDAAGLEAAGRLAERLQGRIAFEIKSPPPPAKDWAT
jgi:putative DNA primase/helicase